MPERAGGYAKGDEPDSIDEVTLTDLLRGDNFSIEETDRILGHVATWLRSWDVVYADALTLADEVR